MVGQCHTGRRERGPHAEQAGRGAVVALDLTGNDGKLPMPKRQQIAGHCRRRVGVINADREVLFRGIGRPGQLIRHADFVEQRQQGRIVLQTDQNEPINAALHQVPGRQQLFVNTVVVGGQQQGVTGFRKRL